MEKRWLFKESVVVEYPKYWLRVLFYMLFSALYDAVLCDHSTHAGYSTVPQEVVFFLIVYREEYTFFLT